PSRIVSMVFVPNGIGGGAAILVCTDIGIYAMSTRTPGLWVPFGTTLPRTYAYTMVYSHKNGRDVLVVGTLGRGEWKLNNASQSLFGGSGLYGAAPSDQPFEVDLPVQTSVSTTNATSASFTVGATARTI